MSRKHFEVPDRGLWDEVTRSIHPLVKTRRRTDKPVLSRPATLKLATTLAPAPHIVHPPKAKPIAAKPVPPIARFDRKTEQRMTRGKVEIEARIDLHGETVELARVKLLQFIIAQRNQGVRLVLVITGKGASPFTRHTLHGRDLFHAPEREGKLRRELPLWLHEVSFRDHVTGFQPAHPRHGGGGAFYVRLRRSRESSHDAIW